MTENDAYLSITLNTTDPIEIRNFARLFVAIDDQFRRHTEDTHPDLKGEVKIYIRELKSGSLIADIVPIIGAAIVYMEAYVVVTGFAKKLKDIIATYMDGQKKENASKKDIDNVIDLCKTVAHDKDGEANIESVRYSSEGEKRNLEIKFGTPEARRAIAAAKAHMEELNTADSAEHERVLMVFERSSIKDISIGKSSGERVIIEGIDQKSRPLIYASDLSERQIKHVIRNSDDNIFKKGFIVDVHVQIRKKKVVAYRVTHLHQIIDVDDNDDGDNYVSGEF